MKRLLLIVLFFCLGCQFQVKPDDKRIVVETDQDRINEIHQIAAIVEEYKEKRGCYPFSERWRQVKPGYCATPIYIIITDQKIAEDMMFPPGMSATSIPKKMFDKYLTEKLGRSIRLPTDSRPVSTKKFYQYLFDGENYFLSCILDKSAKLTKQLSADMFKYQVSSTAIPTLKIWKYKNFIYANKNDDGEFCFQWWPDLPVIEGWHQDETISYQSGMNIQLPVGNNYQNADAVISAAAIYKKSVPEIQSIQEFIKSGFEKAMESFPELNISRGEVLVSNEGKRFIFHQFDLSPGKADCVAYAEEDDFYLTIILTARSKELFEKHLFDFEKFVRNYKEGSYLAPWKIPYR